MRTENEPFSITVILKLTILYFTQYQSRMDWRFKTAQSPGVVWGVQPEWPSWLSCCSNLLIEQVVILSSQLPNVPLSDYGRIPWQPLSYAFNNGVLCFCSEPTILPRSFQSPNWHSIKELKRIGRLLNKQTRTRMNYKISPFLFPIHKIKKDIYNQISNYLLEVGECVEVTCICKPEFSKDCFML